MALGPAAATPIQVYNNTPQHARWHTIQDACTCLSGTGSRVPAAAAQPLEPQGSLSRPHSSRPTALLHNVKLTACLGRSQWSVTPHPPPPHPTPNTPSCRFCAQGGMQTNLPWLLYSYIAP